MIDNGIGCDVVCLGRPPLHTVPLFKFPNDPNSVEVLLPIFFIFILFLFYFFNFFISASTTPKTTLKPHPPPPSPDFYILATF